MYTIVDMNKGILLQKLKYHYKRYLSITFASIGLALLIGALTYFSITNRTNSYTMMGSLWNYIILLVSFIFILYGTIQGTAIAYNGILMFIFFLMWDFGSAFVINWLSGSILNLFSGDPLVIAATLISLGGNLVAFLIGIFLYIRLRQFLTGRYASYTGLRNLSLIFTIFVILFNIVVPILFIIYSPTLDTILSLLYYFAIIFEALAVFFTICRLKSNY